MRAHMPMALMLLGFLWAIQLVNALMNYRLNYLGIFPRHVSGLMGIVFAPFLHGSFNHLFFNSIPLFALSCFLLIKGTPAFVMISVIIIIFSGFGTWLFGRRGIHIGASSVIMGYFGFLLVNAYKHPSVMSFALGVLCVYYFGSLFLSLFPQEERVSWEGHVIGFAAGILAVYLYH